MGALGLEFRILGPLEVRAGGVAVPMGGPRQRALLALLLLSANRVVSRDRLIEELMLDPPGEKAQRALTVQASRLRKALASVDGNEPRLVASPPGYVLRVMPGELDLDTFEGLLEEGRRAFEESDPARAAAAFREGEALWRGQPLADLEFEPFARLEVGRLEELRLAAVEERIEAELELGRHAALVPELEALVAEHPLRERLRALLMVALYRAGRQAEALETYRAGRRELHDELGLEPSPELQELERAILTHDPTLRLEQAILTNDPALPLDRAIPAHDPVLEPAARAQWAPKRRFHRELAVGLAAGLVVAAAIVLVLVSGGSPSVRLAANEIGAIDTGTGQVALALPVSSPPTSVAVGDGSIWVVSAAAGTLSRIDAKTDLITQITVGSDPVAVAVAPNGTVWVANSGDGTVSRVSPENNQVVGPPLRVGAGPSALVATNNAVWVANMLNASVSRISLPSEDVTSIPVGSEPAGIAAGDGSIWVANEGDGTVYTLDQRTAAQVAAPIQVGSGLTGVAFGSGAAWVVDSTGLSRIDPQSNSVTATIPVGQGPYDVAAGPGGVWVSDEYSNAIAHVNPATLTVVHIPTSSAPLGLALAGDRLWVATDGSGTVAHRGGIVEALASRITGLDYGDPPTIDPGSTYSPYVWRVLVTTSDGLVGYRREGGVAGNELVPDLAVALPAPTNDGVTYTFHIRSGIRYSNGALLRASDFRRGLQRAFKLPGMAIDLGSITGAAKCLAHPASCDLSQGVVTDDATNTVTIHLTAPDPDLFAQLALPAAYPVPPGTPVHLTTRSVPGTGPYEISSYSPDLSNNPHAHGLLVLKRNPYFRLWSVAAQPAGFPNQIVIHTNYSQAQQVTAVQTGRADIAWDAPAVGQMTALSESFPSQLHLNAARQTGYVWLNARSTPFDNLLARQAFNYAVNRGALAQSLAPFGLEGEVDSPTCQLLPPDFPGYVPYCPYTENLLKAQQLVRESGTYRARVTLLVPGFARGVGRSLVATLRAIGYRARLAPSPMVFGEAPNFYLHYQAGLASWAADYVSPAQVIPDLVECSIPSGPNFGNSGRICDPGLDAKIANTLREEPVNPGLASQDWTAIDHEIVNQALDVPLENQLAAGFVARRVGNYQYNPQWGMLMDQLWVR